MSQPAARQGDMTGHGGTIAVGDPTVLINGMPAARQGDMHVCPMCNGPVPHVGGPIMQGAPTVLINGMPAARLGDMCTCTGPPDPIAMGEPTVLIGSGGNPVKIGGSGQVMIGGSGPVMIGGGTTSGGGGGGGSAGKKGALAAAATAASGTPEATTLREHWLEITFEDAAGNPVSGTPYQLDDPDGKKSESWLKAEGMVRRSGVSSGQGTVTVMSVTDATWSASETTVGKDVTITATAKGFEDGTEVTVQIKEVPDTSEAASVVDEIETEVSGEELEATWVYDHPSEAENETERTASGQPASFIAEVDVKGYPLPTVTGYLRVKATVEFKLRNETAGQALTGTDYRLLLASGEVREGTTDDSGEVLEKDVPLGPIKLL